MTRPGLWSPSRSAGTSGSVDAGRCWCSGSASLLSAMTYLAATNQAMNFLEQREAVNLTLQVGLAVGVLLTVVVSADAISGERERGTFEGTAAHSRVPARDHRRQARRRARPCGWPASSSRSPTCGSSGAAWRAPAGGTARPGRRNTGRDRARRHRPAHQRLARTPTRPAWPAACCCCSSLFAPTQLPALPKTGIGELLTRVNPIGSALHYISQILVNRRGWTHDLSYLACSGSSSPLVVVTVLIVAGPRLVRADRGVAMNPLSLLATVLLANPTITMNQDQLSARHRPDADASSRS